MVQAKRLQSLEEEMSIANEEYIAAVARASQSQYPLSHILYFRAVLCCVVDTLYASAEALHAQIDGVLKNMLSEDEFAAEVEGPG